MAPGRRVKAIGHQLTRPRAYRTRSATLHDFLPEVDNQGVFLGPHHIGPAAAMAQNFEGIVLARATAHSRHCSADRGKRAGLSTRRRFRVRQVDANRRRDPSFGMNRPV